MAAGSDAEPSVSDLRLSTFPAGVGADPPAQLVSGAADIGWMNTAPMPRPRMRHRGLAAGVLTLPALLVAWSGQASAQQPAPACPDTVQGWPLTATLLAPPADAGVLRLMCSYQTAGGYTDPDYGIDLTFDAHWWPEGTAAPVWFCPPDAENTRQLPSSTAAAEVGWKWTSEAAFPDALLDDAAHSLLRQVEPLAQQCPPEAENSQTVVAAPPTPPSGDAAPALPAAPANSGGGGGVGDLAVPAAVVAAAAAAALAARHRRSRRPPSLGDRLAADALGEAIAATNAPSLGDQLAVDQIRRGMALGGPYPFEGIPPPPPE